MQTGLRQQGRFFFACALLPWRTLVTPLLPCQCPLARDRRRCFRTMFPHRKSRDLVRTHFI